MPSMADDPGWVGPDILLPALWEKELLCREHCHQPLRDQAEYKRLQQDPTPWALPPSCARVIPLCYGRSLVLGNHPHVDAKVKYLQETIIHELLFVPDHVWRDVYITFLLFFSFENVLTYIEVVKIVRWTPKDIDSSVGILPPLFYVSVYVRFTKPFPSRIDYRLLNASPPKYFIMCLQRKRTFCI